MAEELFLILGTGQKVLKEINDRNYRKAKYYLPSNPNAAPVETPFVGEAIIRLFPKRFSKVYIFGTQKSMWETLYAHSLQLDETKNETELNENDIRIFGKLSFAIENNNIEEHPEYLDYVAKAFGGHLGIETECHLIPIGENEKEIWKIFGLLTKIKTKNTKISFDITHGLRYQPFFFLISLFYLNSVDTSIRIGSIFYGGLELKSDPQHNDCAPILEFKVFSEVIDWINAAKIYNKYKDFTALSELLKKYDNMDKLAEALRNFSNCYKLNYFNNIKDYANNVIKSIENIKDATSEPFNLIKNELLSIPKEIIDCQSNLEIILKIANHQWKSKHYGLVVIALWEAILEKFILVFNGKYTKYEIQQALPKFLYNKNYISIINSERSNLHKNLIKLHEIRNSIAHLDLKDSKIKNFNIENIHSEIEKLFNYFYNNLLTIDFTKFKDIFTDNIEKKQTK